jgi:hypothetical protein
MYKCITVKANSSHWLSQWVEDDEGQFVIHPHLEGIWWKAEEFFECKGAMMFEVVEEG